MDLSRFERSDRVIESGVRTRYVTGVRDVSGAENYQFIIDGPSEMTEEVFKESDFEVTIEPTADPNAAAEEMERRLQPAWEAKRQVVGELTGLERVENFYKPLLPEPAPLETTLFVSLKRVRGEGSAYVVFIPQVLLPSTFTLIVALPFVCVCWAIVTPFVGDPDLVLALNGPFNPPGGVARSSNPPGVTDVIVFGGPCWPWQMFVPFFRVRSFIFGGTPPAFSMLWGGTGVP